MRSGELARLVGISTDTLRHYERLGLLPKPSRSTGGYRDYPPQALERVRLIRRALSVNFSLPELRTLLKKRDAGEFPCREAQKLAKSKLEDVKNQIKDWTALRAQLEEILKNWDSRLARGGGGKPARLLESLPDGLKRAEPKMQFKQKLRSKEKP
ncbi:MAG: heavy metal-responsive transcriptional regulator [Terriglobales bacterium]